MWTMTNWVTVAVAVVVAGVVSLVGVVGVGVVVMVVVVVDNDKTYVIISSQSETYCCYIERVGDEVRNVPHVTYVLL